MKKIDLSDIKENDLDKTSSFTDLMSKRERKNREKQRNIETESNEVKNDFDDIEEMVTEKKRSTKDLTLDVEKAKKELENLYQDDEKEENLAKTQLLDLTRQMKFNLEENKKINKEKKKKGISKLNIIGEVNLLCIGYYIYLLVFTSFQDNRNNYLINGGIIVSLVLLFGLSIITRKIASNFFNILNIIMLIVFIGFNAYTLIN